MTIMSVDLGDARTGVAYSADEKFVFPKCVITEYNTDRLVQKLVAAARELSAELIVVGLPKNMDSSLGEKAEKCRKTAEYLQEESGIKVELWDERLSTVEAHKMLDYSDVRGKKRKGVVDAVAATIILEDFLRYRENLKK